MAAIGFFVTRGQPKITVDYLAEYNRISQPINYDPCLNAADLYKEAFDSFVQMPKQLQRGDRIYAKWVDDFNRTEQDLLQKWLIANTDCFQKFRKASQKPYNWAKRECARGNELISIKFLNIMIDSSDMSDAMAWNAKLNAAQGKYIEAFDDVLTIYRASSQMCTTSLFLIEFRYSLWFKQKAVETLSLVLAKTQVPAHLLKSFQQKLEEISDAHTCFSDFTAEKLALYDILQRTYVYKPDGSGRLSWKGMKDLSGYDVSCCGKGGWWLIKNWFAGPTQKEVKSQIDSYYEKVNTAFMITPWELHLKQPDYFEKLEHQRFDMLFLFVWGSDYRRNYYNYYDSQAQLQALLTMIAVMRFRQDKGYLPGELNELVEEGYLRQLPADPYSNKSLVYSVKGEDFKLYSIGNNFKDNGGEGGFLPRPLYSSNTSPNLVFWPLIEPRKIYLNRRQPIQESNQPQQKPSE